jgi:hypothetical protein
MPSWQQFQDRAVDDFDIGSPAAELAAVLKRHHAELDAAARASAEGRAQSVRALAEQAVLAIELERVLAGSGRDQAHVALAAVKDRMLANVEAAGLELIRLEGRPLAEIERFVDIDSWRYDDRYRTEVVVAELELAVAHHGEPVRRGRVIVGAAPGGGPRPVVDEPWQVRTRTTPAVVGRTQILCPVESCRAVNERDADVCVACLTLLGGYTRLSLFPSVLYNRGLQAVREGRPQIARECFAAVVLWQPDAIEARNAYALACLDCHDQAAARDAWAEVLARSPADPIASRGLAALRQAAAGLGEPAL